MALKFLNNGYFAGKVGIGAESPSVALQLGNSTLGQTKLAIFNSEGGGEVGLTIQSRTNRAKLRVADNDSNAYVVAEAGKSFFGTSANGDANNITVLTGGNVGIGTTSPGYKLSIRATTASHQLFSINRANSDTAALFLGNNSSSNAIISSNNTDLIIGKDQSNTFTEYIRVQNNSGNVGIGNTNPQYPLHFGDISGYYISIGSGNSTPGGNTPWLGVFNNNSITSATYGWGIYDSSADGSFQIWNRAGNTTGYNTFTIKRGGNVGIGTTSPSTRFEVAASATTSVDIAHFSNSNDVVKIKHALDGVGSGRVSIFDASNNEDVRLSAQSNSWFNGGDVGIGTTDPVGDLHLYGGQQNIVLTNTNADGVAGSTISRIIGQARGYSNNLSVMQSIDFETNATAWYKGDIVFKTNGTDGTDTSVAATERMRITSAGGISFGSTGTAYGTSGQILKSNGNASPTWIDGSAIPGVPAGSGTGNYLARWTPNGDTLGIGVVYDNGTNVGIGIDDPAARLEVKQNLYVSHPNAEEITFRLDNYGATGTDAGPLLRMFNQSGTTVVNIDSRSGSSRDTYFNQGGNFGIGTTSPNEKLEVVGNIKIQSVVLSNQENTDVDTGTETVAEFSAAAFTAGFFDFVIKKTTNVRSGTVYACHDGTNVEFTETSTQDLGDTSDVTLSVDISGGNMRLRATTTSDDWSVKSLIRAI